MKTSDFYYDLPERLIAQVPTKDRLASRLLVLDKKTGRTIDGHFPDIKKYLKKGDVLRREERYFLVLATDNAGYLGGTTIIYLEERKDLK